ncbi:MAG: hypothetical protein IJR18_01675, partial [Campylobacter sp.]|nr:hypothetical protein [Campylobacter sp.]
KYKFVNLKNLKFLNLQKQIVNLKIGDCHDLPNGKSRNDKLIQICFHCHCERSEAIAKAEITKI